MDSRYAATRLYIREKWPIGKKVSLFLVVTAIALLGTWLFNTSELTASATYTLFILLLATGLWITEAIPSFAVGLLVIGLEIYFLSFSRLNGDLVEWEKFVNTLSSPVIWLLLGGFFMAAAARLTGLDIKLSQIVISILGGKPQVLLMGIMLTTAILSMFISNTATTAMMMTVIAPFIHKLQKGEPFGKALPLGVALAASVGGMGTIIGSPPNAIATGVISEAGMTINFMDWMLFGFPLALFFTLLIWLVLSWRYKSLLTTVEVSFEGHPKSSPFKLSRKQVIVMVTFAFTVLMWLTTSMHKVTVAAVSFIPIVVLSVTGIVKAEHIRLLPWDTILLVAGGLSLGVAINETGLADYLVAMITLQNASPFFLMLVLGYITMILSNIMSNTAAATILMPIGIAMVQDENIKIALVIALSSSTAILLPISTPPNAIAYSTGYLKQSEFTFTGLLIGLIGPLAITAVIYLL